MEISHAPEHGGDELFVSGLCLLLFGARGQRGHVDVSQSQRVSVADGGGATPRRRPVDRRGVVHLLQGNLKMKWKLTLASGVNWVKSEGTYIQPISAIVEPSQHHFKTLSAATRQHVCRILSI